jgi:hypothetical protein
MDSAFRGSVRGFQPTDRGAEIDFAGASVEEVASLLEGFFQGDGFSLENGTRLEGRWGSGSRLGRALGGGLVKRRKYEVKIAPDGDGVHVTLASAMSGLSGSLLGVSKERAQRKEFMARLQAFLEALSPRPNGELPPVPPPPTV